MAIRRAPRPDTRVYALSQVFSEGCNLSWRARGIFAYAVLHELEVSVANIQQWPSSKNVGREQAISIFNELLNAGFLALQGTHKAAYLKKKIPEAIRQQVLSRDNHRCVECQSIKRLTIDHIFPESKGGSTTLDNLQVLCRSCNIEKGTKLSGGGKK